MFLFPYLLFISKIFNGLCEEGVFLPKGERHLVTDTNKDKISVSSQKIKESGVKECLYIMNQERKRVRTGLWS